MILDVPDLVTWLVDFYRKQLHKNETNRNEKAVNHEKINSNRSAENKNLLDKVDFNEENIKDNSRK